MAETGTAIQGGAYTAIDIRNYALFENYGKDFPGGTTSRYTVKGGETLQGFANILWAIRNGLTMLGLLVMLTAE